MNVRAKFCCTGINHIYAPSPNTPRVAEVRLQAVWGDGRGNESWSKATPQGEIKMMITNGDAIDAFELGQSYMIDFTPVPKD